jgi:DNA segregation ATPase FtsK/SpoIIIE, S-DNA-T family
MAKTQSRKRPKKKKIEKKEHLKSRKEIYGVLIILISVLFFLSIFLDESRGLVLGEINKSLSYVFGNGKYVFPFLLLGWAVTFFLKKQRSLRVRLGSGFILLFLSILGILGNNTDLGSVFDDIFMQNRGGVLGAAIYRGLFALVDRIGSIVVLISMLIIALLLITNIPFFKKIRDGALSKRKRSENKVSKKPAFRDTSQVRIDYSQELRPSKENKKRFPNIIDHVKKENKSEHLEEKVEKTAKGKGHQLKMPFSPSREEDGGYKLPPESLLKKSKSISPSLYRQNVKENINILNKLFSDFNLAARVSSVTRGPSVTLYELTLSPGLKVQRLLSLEDDFCVALGSSDIRILTPIPGKSAIGIEVPNKIKSIVTLGDIYSLSDENISRQLLRIPLGKNLSGNIIYMDINQMPHILIAGATNSGKSSCLNSIITSLLLKVRPWEVKFIMIDPKMVELSIYTGISHLLSPVVIDPKKAASVLAWAVEEMENRFKVLVEYNCKSLDSFNEAIEKMKIKDEEIKQLPYIIIFVDELADLMMISASEVEESICRIAQMGRAVGIHLVIATQRPSVNVITGLIKANIPSRIAFNVASNMDSRVILDMGGAEKLIGRGDMLYLPSTSNKPERIQGSFVTSNEIEIITDYIKDQRKPVYNKDIAEKNVKNDSRELEEDDLIYDAMEIFLEFGHASASLLQRRLRIGYSRAARIVDQLENRGFISGHEGAKPREILISWEDFKKIDRETTQKA